VKTAAKRPHERSPAGTESSESDRDADATRPDAQRETADEDAGETVDRNAGETVDGNAGEAVDARLRAVERAVAGTDGPITDIADSAAATAERERLAERLDAVEERVAELEAATQAVRGYAGAIRAVNREVERRADLALARATAARDGGRATGRDDDRDAVATGSREAATPDSEAATPDSEAATPDAETAEVGGVVPSERALDAALPSDSWSGRGGAADRDGADPDERVERRDADGDDETGGEPLGTAALERLRESL